MISCLVRDALLNAVGKKHTDYSTLEYKDNNNFQGDIDKILYPLDRHQEYEYDFSEYMSYNYIEESDVTASTVRTSNDTAEGGLLCFRDSFGNSLLPFLAQDFSYGYFSKSVPYRIDYIAGEEFDTCIIELVERNLVNLIKLAPVMPAPLRYIEEEITVISEKNCTAEVSQYDIYYKINGFVDEQYTTDDSPVYIEISNEAASYIIEAFPCDASSLTGKPSDYGYTAYIGMNSLPAGEYNINIITYDGGYYKEDTGNTIQF